VYPLAQSGDLAGAELGVLELESALEHLHVLAVPTLRCVALRYDVADG
jgi:hypothetical protein